MPNLIEYAMGTDPLVADSGKVDVALEASEGGSMLTLVYQKDLSATGIAYQVEASDDLAGWSDVDDVPVSSAEGIETRKASVAVSGFPRRWLRLRVNVVSPD